MVERRRGPSPVESIFSGEEDVTTELTQWLGPSHDFHKTFLTPGQIGYKTLTIERSDGITKRFEENDIMNI